jgi:hypothetical protein
MKAFSDLPTAAQHCAGRCVPMHACSSLLTRLSLGEGLLQTPRQAALIGSLREDGHGGIIDRTGFNAWFSTTHITLPR